jgi:hypothetical protein
MKINVFFFNVAAVSDEKSGGENVKELSFQQK